METERKRVSTILMCAGLVLLASCLGLAQERAGSVLGRLQTIEDPELGELIRVAIDNYRRLYTSGPGSDEELKIVRDVTEAYARITLLDRQIEETKRHIGETAGEVHQEMILAGAELESKRTMELASLRQIMRIIPTHAFGRRPVDQLKVWLVLDALDDKTVAVYEGRQPFRESNPAYSLVGVMSFRKACDYVAKQLDEADRLPIRVDIQRTAAGIGLSNGIEKEVTALIRAAGLEMQAEVHLDNGTWRSPGLELFVLKGQVGTKRLVRDGLPYLMGTIEPNDLGGYVEQWLSQPKHLPATLELDYDPASAATVDRLAQTVTTTAQRLGIAQLVKVKRTLHPPSLRTQYLGQWEASVDGEAVRVAIEHPDRVQVLEIENGRITSRKGGHWSMEGDRIAVSVAGEMLTGTIDESGTLFLVSGTERIAFRKKAD